MGNYGSLDAGISPSPMRKPTVEEVLGRLEKVMKLIRDLEVGLQQSIRETEKQDGLIRGLGSKVFKMVSDVFEEGEGFGLA